MHRYQTSDFGYQGRVQIPLVLTGRRMALRSGC
jgi:hypothetical protein